MADTQLHQTIFKTNLGQEIVCGGADGYLLEPEIPDGCYVISIGGVRRIRGGIRGEDNVIDQVKFSYICHEDLDEIGEIDHIYIRD